MLSAISSNPDVSIPQDVGTDDSAAQLSDVNELLALMVRAQTASQASSKTDVELDYQHLEELKQKLAEAIERAKEAAEHSGFFGMLGKVFGGDVAQIAGAVAAVAAIVATGGAAGPLIVLAVSAALEEGAKAAEKLGLDPKLCAAIAIAGAAVGLCTGAGAAQAGSTLGSIAQGVKVGAECTAAAGSATGGVLGYVSGRYSAQQLRAQADATGYQAKRDATDMSFDDAISLLQASLTTEQRETTVASAIVQDNAHTNSTLSERI